MVKREELIQQMIEKMKGEFSKEILLMHVENVISDMDEILNMKMERVKNWYKEYLPEVEPSKIGWDKYIDIIIGYKRGKIPDEYKDIIPKESLGYDLETKDLDMIKRFAQNIRDDMNFRDRLVRYREELINEIAPNLTYLLGPILATKLVVEAKGLKRLARLPASSIQVLGAEKALFLHLTKHTKPPKHGIIFLHPVFRGSKKKVRGKIARLLAAKISLAAKADAFTRKFIAEELKEDLERKLKEVK